MWFRHSLARQRRLSTFFNIMLIRRGMEKRNTHPPTTSYFYVRRRPNKSDSQPNSQHSVEKERRAGWDFYQEADERVENKERAPPRL